MGPDERYQEEANHPSPKVYYAILELQSLSYPNLRTKVPCHGFGRISKGSSGHMGFQELVC
jgi:hypothetical protein